MVEGLTKVREALPGFIKVSHSEAMDIWSAPKKLHKMSATVQNTTVESEWRKEQRGNRQSCR